LHKNTCAGTIYPNKISVHLLNGIYENLIKFYFSNRLLVIMKLNELFNLSGKTALVTGCSRGIGKAMATGLAAAGADIIGVSSSLEPGSDIEKEIIASGQKFSSYKINLEDRNELLNSIDQIKSAHPVIDILINNAGTIKRSPAVSYTDADWDTVLNINLNSAFVLAREFGKEMVQRQQGKIIFTCSLLSFQGGINVAAYTASKSAVAGLVKALANEWASKGVNVNGIAPGYIATKNTEALRQDAARNQSIQDRIPAGRWGTPDDLVGPVVFLSSAASDYVHGEILTVDGGWMGR
jgi:2-dehydro-3-deoxy-D-gluconate 5-dehydrogenase